MLQFEEIDGKRLSNPPLICRFGGMSWFNKHQVGHAAPTLKSTRRVKKGLILWTASGRAIANGRDEGLTKLLFDDSPEAHSYGKVLGGSIVGTHAGDMIGEIALAIVNVARSAAGWHPGTATAARGCHGRTAACGHCRRRMAGTARRRHLAAGKALRLCCTNARCWLPKTSVRRGVS